MECETDRQSFDAGDPEAAVAAHLANCPACATEMALSLRMAAAVASLPRIKAPDALVGRVMAELRLGAQTSQRPPRLPAFVLRPWEIGWLGAVCLLLLVGIPVVLGGWPTQGSLSGWSLFASWRAPLRSSALGLMTELQQWKLDFGGAGRLTQQMAALWSAMPLPWVLGAAGFAIALLWLLSRHGEVGRRPEWEDAHA